MCALVVAEIPDHKYASAIGTDKLALVGVDHHIVDGMVMGVVSLHKSRSCIPDSYSAVFGACDHPFAFAVECYSCDIVRMSFETHDGVGVARLDVVQSDDMSTCGSQVFLVRSNT